MVTAGVDSLSPWEGSTQPQRSNTTTIEQATLSIAGTSRNIMFCLKFYHPFVKNQLFFSGEIMVSRIAPDLDQKGRTRKSALLKNQRPQACATGCLKLMTRFGAHPTFFLISFSGRFPG
jgi:hypothetical protein